MSRIVSCDTWWIIHVTHRMSHVTEWKSHVTHNEWVMSHRMSHLIWYNHVTNEWVMSQNEWVMSHNEKVMSHTTNESCHIEWVIWYDIIMSRMNESCHKMNESCHRMNESCHTQRTSHVTERTSHMIWYNHVTNQRVMSRNERVMPTYCVMSHNKSRHTYEWVTSHLWTSHATHNKRVESHIGMRHVHIWQGMPRTGGVTAHIWMSHAPHINESWHTYQRVSSHVRDACQYVSFHGNPCKF